MSSLSQVAAAADEAIIETREASPAHFLIKIDSFSLLGKHGIDKLETSEFASGGYKWRLIIYPKGHGTGKNGEGYVSVYLALANTSALPANWEVNAVFSISLFNHISGNYRYALGRARRFHELKLEWGFDKFISIKNFKDPSNGYLIDDKCVVFGAEVFVNENKAVTECLSVKSVDTDPYKHEFKISNFSRLKDVWISDEFTVGGHKWKIEVYPNGNGEETGRSLSVFLRRVVSSTCNLSERVSPRYTFRIKDQSSGQHHHQLTSYGSWFSASGSNSSWGFLSFIKLSSLNDPNKGFIVKDCCLLEIDLAVQAISSSSSS